MGKLEEVKVNGVYMAQTGIGIQPVVLLDDSRQKLVPIYIGPAEALAIDLGHRKETTPRPMTHDLMHDLIDKLGASVTKVIIDDLDENVFYARLTIKVNGEEKEVDARPSDSVALALRFDAAIMVDDEVLERVAVSKDDIQNFKDFSDFVE